MPWITPEDVDAVYGETVSQKFIDHVQSLAEVVTGSQLSPSAQLQATFVDIVYRKHLAATRNPDGVQSELLGSYQYMQPNAPGLGLTKAEKRDLKQAVGRIGLWVQPTTRGQVETPPIKDFMDDDDLLENFE